MPTCHVLVESRSCLVVSISSEATPCVILSALMLNVELNVSTKFAPTPMFIFCSRYFHALTYSL